MSKQYFALLAGVAVIAAGCNQDMPVRSSADRIEANDKQQSATAPAPTAPAAPRVAAAATAPIAIPFNDIQNFDKELERSLKANPDKVTVLVEDRISLKDMPPRVDKWLAAVDSGGGKVNVKSDVPEVRSRALPLIGAAISAFQFFREHAKEAQYNAAKSYDATVFYKRDANGDRIVDRIEMQRRPGE